MITSPWPNRLNGRIEASDSKADRARRNRATGAFWNAPGATRSAESRGNNELPGELRFHVLRGYPVERNPSHRVGGVRMPNFPGGDFDGNFRASSAAPFPNRCVVRRRTLDATRRHQAQNGAGLALPTVRALRGKFCGPSQLLRALVCMLLAPRGHRVRQGRDMDAHLL